ncbi:single-stranded DNA-binding protein [Caldicellulosiruptor bescii]|jgi:primosomal replication protein N|uniref:Single-strand binding protein/Primosomal replication protein n n=2 Tax=Caldicellulosiruptor bescii TaxID=31899 RepID=B9MJQ0_CALBD|nr:single-stranded DNA-binding protein [Caldicellulosiruptor bescii]ACM60558.1 single-strand binding protein/Primosomal replication protein n [Caldicellulosiruptor bescii DSM 6725]PBC87969.1 single-stranded DNA-binding protein [Caldicellulosiruptor bescii]PBC90901.1 single-stranded DNA-binding protein [Caldicellulosiruptor bescii]PBD03667.1 single-stranded DNA-binding protein [Caldicellulosiruptor bescii]PBD06699.1 single-stranded DNA-binding protein [Caldicellulosiruptor bescii]
MSQNPLENNRVYLCGKVVTPLNFSHESFGEKFFTFKLEVPRLSQQKDILIVTVSDRLLINVNLEEGSLAEVLGQFRSYNNPSNVGNRLILTVFARDIKNVESIDPSKNINEIFLNGYVCKKPQYRTTPLGREITDILLAVNRLYGKSDYIPCIAWGRNARFASTFQIGDNIKIWGRVQSRDYQKKLEDGRVEIRTAYEVSIFKLERVEKSENVS